MALTEKGVIIYENACMGAVSSYSDFSKAGDVNKGKLFTGDMAKFDKDGFYFITGRKRFIKMHGNRISLDSVESKLNSMGYHCSCIGLDEKLIIFSEKKEELKDLLKQLKNYLRSILKILLLRIY